MEELKTQELILCIPRQIGDPLKGNSTEIRRALRNLKKILLFHFSGTHALSHSLYLFQSRAHTNTLTIYLSHSHDPGYVLKSLLLLLSHSLCSSPIKKCQRRSAGFAVLWSKSRSFFCFYLLLAECSWYVRISCIVSLRGDERIPSIPQDLTSLSWHPFVFLSVDFFAFCF